MLMQKVIDSPLQSLLNVAAFILILRSHTLHTASCMYCAFTFAILFVCICLLLVGDDA